MEKSEVHQGVAEEQRDGLGSQGPGIASYTGLRQRVEARGKEGPGH